jgi:hypothetical protein
MLEIIDKIKKIINPQVVLNICTDNQTLTIKENDPQSKIKKLIIKDIPEDAFAFTLDYKPKQHDRCFQQLSCYVNKATKGINKGCDLVLMIPQENKEIKILIFDLKSDKPKREETRIQLLNSELYVHYLLLMVENHHDIPINEDEIKFQQTIIVSSERNPSKRPTYRPNKERYSQDDSETYKKISRTSLNKKASIYLNELLH